MSSTTMTHSQYLNNKHNKSKDFNFNIPIQLGLLALKEMKKENQTEESAKYHNLKMMVKFFLNLKSGKFSESLKELIEMYIHLKVCMAYLDDGEVKKIDESGQQTVEMSENDTLNMYNWLKKEYEEIKKYKMIYCLYASNTYEEYCEIEKEMNKRLETEEEKCDKYFEQKA